MSRFDRIQRMSPVQRAFGVTYPLMVWAALGVLTWLHVQAQLQSEPSLEESTDVAQIAVVNMPDTVQSVTRN